MTEAPELQDRSLRRLLLTFVGWFVVFLALTGTWAFANPLKAAPDEAHHAIKAAAVVRGELLGEPSRIRDGSRDVLVPNYFAVERDTPCYGTIADQPAGCLTDLDGDNDRLVVAHTPAGSYNPLYYAVVGLPSLVLENERAFYAMRLASAFVNSLFFALGATAVWLLGRNLWPRIAAVVAVTPMVLFLCSSINPNSLEIAAGFALAAWLALLSTPAARGISGWAFLPVALSAIALANCRSVALVWAAIIIGAFAVTPTLWRLHGRRVSFWVAIAAIGLGVGFAGAWIIVADSNAPPGFLGPGAGEVTFADGFARMLAATFENTQGYVGAFGWLDTPIPQTIVNLWGGAMVVLVALGVIYGRGWPRLTLAVLAAAFVLAPAVTQGYTWYEYGYIWQPRYILAVLVALMVTAGWVLGRSSSVPAPDSWPKARVIGWLGVVLLFWMHLVAFMQNLKRYVVGLGEGQTWLAMVREPMWQPPFGWPVMAVLYVLITVVALVTVFGVASPWHDRVPWLGKSGARAGNVKQVRPERGRAERTPSG